MNEMELLQRAKQVNGKLSPRAHLILEALAVYLGDLNDQSVCEFK